MQEDQKDTHRKYIAFCSERIKLIGGANYISRKNKDMHSGSNSVSVDLGRYTISHSTTRCFDHYTSTN